MAELLKVPYSRQSQYNYCLPACVQMALAYLGIKRSQDALARTLEMFEDYGVSSSHLLRLHSKQIKVVYKIDGSIDELRWWLDRQLPVIVFVNTGLLTYWKGKVTQHAAILIGIDEQAVFLLDPDRTEKVETASITEFLLAWDEMEFAFGVITKW